ncbi:MAG: THUMP-like domain-containing protein [Flavobacterium sp.]
MPDFDIFNLLSPNIQQFIDKHLNYNLQQLALKKNPFPEIDFKLILNQIETKNKSKNKLPTWYNTQNILFPSKLSIEQTSSEITANYKSKLLNINSLVDITGGFGIDAFYFSKKIEKVFYVEKQEDLVTIVKHNYVQLNALNIECYLDDGLEFLDKNQLKVDAIYIDPARRNENINKVFLWEDCTPNIIENKEKYFDYANVLMVKTSPLFDINLGIKILKNVKEIHIVGIENEVKELLWILEKNYISKPKIFAVNIKKNQEDILESIDYNNEIEYSQPLKYLYEPNASLMKMGNFKTIAHSFNLKKLQINSHLFTSNELIEFMGRIFEIETIIPYNKNIINQTLKGKKVNITTRNFPETVAEIKQKFNLKDGGEDYCFFTTLLNNEKNVLLCKKINTP